MPIYFEARDDIPNGVPYVSVRRGDLTVVCYNPTVLGALAASVKTCDIASDLCAAVLNVLDQPPAPKLRLAS